MKTTLLLALLSTIIPLSACAWQAPEVLHLDQNHPKRFLVSNSLHEAKIEIVNHLDAEVEITCDGKVRSHRKLFDRKKIEVTLPVETETCVVRAGEREVQLIKDEVAFPRLKVFHRLVEDCRYSAEGDTNVFLSNNYPMMTCAHPAGEIEILSDSDLGLLAKMEALLGYRPSKDFITNNDPYAPLDFSRAPRLDAIFVSTLLYRHDFTGTVIGRLLKFHAERGTIVNIIGTGYMHEEKDKALLKELSQVRNGNVRVQEFKYIEASLLGKLRLFTNYLRDMHVKMFVTLSHEQPENNILITGGRNIHDGFVFSEKPDFSKFPELDQAPEGAWAYWNDLEIKVQSKELAESVYAHLLKLWNREVRGQVTQNASVATTKIDASGILTSSAPMMRHFLSLPYNDNHALETLYVEMIDKARSSIKLSSPYLRPTKAIMAAFERAIARKVDITIQTRINLAGDTQAWLYEETNKAAINSLFERVHLYEWTESSILHTKMILVDGKFAFFGSVNLSRRSFIQDVENGLVIHDETFVGRLTDTFEGYNQRSRKIEEKQKRKFWASVIVGITQNQF